MDPRLQAGFLGTGASLMADLTLLAYVLLIVPGMLAGFVLARRRLFVPHHKLVMTAITIVNWFLILFLMVVSYSQGVASEVPQGLAKLPILSPTVHLLFGAAAQALATYLVIRMWLENVLPDFMLVKNIKRMMRLTLVLWLVTVALGVVTYVAWYVTPADAQPAPSDAPAIIAPDATEEVVPATPEPAATTVPETEPSPPPPEATDEVEG